MADDMELQIILPPQADPTDALQFGLLSLTEAIEKVDSEALAHGVLGGAYGYGARWENDVFLMRPQYWGDCDCGADERSEAWHAANPHDENCFQKELHRRFDRHDEDTGFKAVEEAYHGPDTMSEIVEETPFGTMTYRQHTALGDELFERWKVAYDKRNKAHAKLTRQLCDERGLPGSPHQWFCTCGVDERAKLYFADEGHYATCSLELPNFLHKASGFEVRWYKWIGRDMHASRELSRAELQRIFSECAASISPPASLPETTGG